MEKAEIRGTEKGRKMGREEMKRLFIINLLSENPDRSNARIAALADTTEEQVAHMRRQSAPRKNGPPSDS